MFKIIDIDAFLSQIEEFLKSGNQVIASSIITPSEGVHAKLVNDEQRGTDTKYDVLHDDIFNFIIGEIYSIGQDIDESTEEGRLEKTDLITDVIPGGECNFVNIRWVISREFLSVIVSIPYYITTYEFDYLAELNQKLKRVGIKTIVEVSKYNPISLEDDDDIEDIYFEDDDQAISNLDIALAYLVQNDRILDYTLPFGEENKLEPPFEAEKTIAFTYLGLEIATNKN